MFAFMDSLLKNIFAEKLQSLVGVLCIMQIKANNHFISFLKTDKHPLGEISLHLDAPPNLVKINDATLLEMRKDFFKSPRGEKKGKLTMCINEVLFCIFRWYIRCYFSICPICNQ